jgi:hypothetical protein
MIEIKRKDGTVIRPIDAESLRGVNLSGNDLRNADLRGRNLQFGCFLGAIATGSYLRGADLSGAILKNADFRECDFRGAHLLDVDFSGAKLQGADFRDAYMHGVNLLGADLTGASLEGAIGLKCKQYVAIIRASRGSIVAIDDDISIGCKRMTLAEWLERFEAVGREARYTEAQIAEYGIYLRAIRDVLESRKNETANG